MMRVLALGVLALAAACSSRSLEGDGGRLSDAAIDRAVPPPSERVAVIPAGGAPQDVDVVFVVDNSGATAVLQQKLVASFEGFIQGLAVPGGAPLSLHVAVVSSDLGAGIYDQDVIPGCQRGGDQGIFQNAPRGTSCAAGGLNADQHFISATAEQNNFQGTIEDAFGCIAALGDTGCAFEHPLGSLLRALGADGNGGAPPENANFLRPNALLAVVIVTNEDDCSAPINTMLFDPTSRYVSDPRGPLSSFRCNEFGHLCGGKAPARTVPADLSGTCHSAEDGVLLRVADVATALKQLKPLTGAVVLSVIAAPPSPYTTAFMPPTIPDDPSPWISIAHSCTTGDGTYGDPAVRLSDLAQAFGPNGLFETLCVDSFKPALQRTAQKVLEGLRPPCFDDKVLDANPEAPMLQPDCTAVAHDEHGGTSPLASCLDATGVTCWELVDDASCHDHKRVAFRLAPAAIASPFTTLTCKICAPNDPRPGCQY